MQGLGGELRRLGIAASGMNRQMAKAEEKARQDYAEPTVPVIARKVKVTVNERQEQELRENLAVIATAYRNGIISEEKARALVACL